MAGLLTCSCGGRLPGISQWLKVVVRNVFMELTAAGLFRICTWFPF